MTSTTRAEDGREWVWLAACIAVIAAIALRWIPIGGIGEYGMMYDQAYGLAAGQVWYRDLLSTHPPLAAHTLGFLFRLFGPSLLLSNAHLYFWWLASLLVGYLLLRRYDIRGVTGSAALLAFASLSLPCFGPGHAYFYAGTVSCGLFVLCLDFGLDHRQTVTFVAGLLAGITVFARQNLGIPVIGGTLLLYLLLLWRGFMSASRARKDAATLLAGLALSCGCFFLIFQHAATGSEVIHELLLDGAHGKAGQYGLLTRLVPRINLNATLTHRRLMEIAVSAIVYAALLLWLARRQSKQDRRGISRSGRQLAIAIGLWLTVNLVTLVPAERVHQWTDSSAWPAIVTASGTLIDLLNIGWLVGLVWFLVTSWRHLDAQTLARCVVALSVFAGTILSDQSYSVHVAPILVPMTIAILGSKLPSQLAVRRLSLLTSIWAIAALFSMPAGFTRLVPIAGAPQFAGVFTTHDYAQQTEELLNRVTPVIRNKTILWVAMYGPHAAFGGNPSPDVVPWDKTTFTSRQVSYLLGRWRANPMDFVVSGPFWGREELLGPHSEFDRWLTGSYSRDWCSNLQPGLCLWERK